jgi:hypothetical protein
MNDTDPQLPEDVRKALKESPTFTPPESFYTQVMRDIRKQDALLRPETPRWAWIWGSPMKLAATTGIIMISYFVARDQTPWGPKKAEVVYDQFGSAGRSPVMAQAPTPTLDKNEIVMLHKIVNAPAATQTGARAAAKDDALKIPRPIDADSVADKSTTAPADAPAVLRERVDAPEKKRAAGAPFPWQSNVQAKQMEPMPALPASIPQLGGGTNAGASHKELSAMAKSKNARLLRDEASGSWSGQDSRISFFRTAVITTAADWTVLWRAHVTSPAPAVDFEQWMVVGLFAGNRPDLQGISIVAVQTLPDQVLVTYQEIPLIPQRGDPAKITPYTLRSIAKTSLPIHFKKL